MLSQLLAQSVIISDPLKLVKVVCKAAWTVDEADQKELAIDYEKITVLNAVANALLNPSIRRLDQNCEVYSVQWGFPATEENYKTHIVPWYNCRPAYWPHLITKHIESWRFVYCYWCSRELGRKKLSSSDEIIVPATCPHCKKDLRYSGLNDRYHTFTRDKEFIVEEPAWSFFFEICQVLSQEGLKLLVHSFNLWASRQAQGYVRELIHIVDPSMYREILGLYTKPGRRDYAQKVKETAARPTDENNMD